MKSVLSYDDFHNYMTKIRRQNKELNEFVDDIENVFPGGWERVMEVCSIDIAVDLLEEIMGDKNHWISFHIFNCEADYDDVYSVYFDTAGNEHPLDSDRDLYAVITGEVEATSEQLEPKNKFDDENCEYF